ncbi:MAG: DUF2088 domain-containing protein [bacterium]|nr:MAG: DUF2088 domain-containing protein [bacterium]
MASHKEQDRLVIQVEKPGEKFLFHCGEQFLWESLPVGTRIIYPPSPFPPIENLDEVIQKALDNPLEADPLSAQLRRGMKLTIALDDLSLPLPPMPTQQDPRKLIIEKVLEKCAENGVTDIHLIAAIGLHRRMTPREIRKRVGKRIFSEFFPNRLSNHDAEDPDGNVMLGTTDHGEEVWLNRQAAESDLLIYVNISLTSMNGGHKSINVGLTTYRSLRHHHNVHTLMNCKSYMDPDNSALHKVLERMGRVVADHVKSFHIETTLNTDTFPHIYSFLRKPELSWTAWDAANFQLMRKSLQAIPFSLRRRIWQSQRSPYGITSIQAGQVDAVHKRTLEQLFRQQAVPIKGQSDIVIAGVPYLSPYNINSIMNPILTRILSLGYCFNLYRGQPLLRKGGVLIFTHPLYKRFHLEHHPSYRDFYEKVLADTRDPIQIEQKYEEKFATDERYRQMFRQGYAYHGVHPFYMWYWGIYGARWAGKVIFVPGDPDVAKRLGFEVAPTVAEAIERAKNFVGPSSHISYFRWPPIFVCDVEC